MEQELQALLRHVRGGQARGLDVLFQRLGDSGVYRVADARYPLAEVDPLRVNLPGGPGDAGALAGALEAALPLASSPEAAVTLLERFGGFVAALDERGAEVGGVSWFDQARVRSALSACGEEVLVLRADVSGIQEFIYRAQSRHASKSLRARSFYLEVLAVHALRGLLAACGVSRVHVAYVGGGGFGLYLPVRFEAEVSAFAQRFDDWLWGAHQGTLGFSVAVVRVPRAQVEAGGEFQRELSRLLGVQKARRRQGRLASVFGGVSLPVPRVEAEEALDAALIAFGGLLPSATHVEVRPAGDAQGRGWVTVQDRAYRPLRARPGDALPPERLALNSLLDLGAFPMFTGNYVTRVRDVPPSLRNTGVDQDEGPDSVASHEQLVDLALGQPRLALYRCDADNMGSFFAGGIPGHSAARHATLSRLMSLFFQGYVNALCAGRDPLLPGLPQAARSERAGHGRYLNIIYSGGDDAVVVGAWNEVLTFAVDLRRAYRAFTGGNDRLGLSGGAFIAKAKFPLIRMADLSHQAEALAKQARDGERVVKDGFVPFLTADAPLDDPRAAVRWNVFASLDGAGGLNRTLDLLGDFLALRADSTGPDGVELDVKRAFLWKLQAFAQRDGDAWRLPLLHYALARATPPASRSTEWQALQRTLLRRDTWPHLGHVLGFLHLARPTATERMD
ncbi:hypothetical protein [Deinococcus sp. JMULE3]|uniref:type III-A CRISPR-associated protein Cas10/Csm1 n=1 Tax=Deinococcus sp. JMULE3 TaxID=2518341 RepID=UPI001576401B|nr:hypothetical protein [Deinococcus sp. JMULE3]